MLRLEDDAEVAVPVRLIRHQRDASFDQCEGFLVPPLLVREHAGVVQRTRMIGCHLEHATVNLVGLDEMFISLQKDRERNRFLERQLTRRWF